MSPWKVILATLVIFCSGLVVGALFVKKTARTILSSRPLHNAPTNAAPLSIWHQQQREFLRRMDRELALNPEQHSKIEKVLKESQDRTKEIREKIAPEMREELKNVREQIRSQLTPDQQKKFEEAMKVKLLRKPDEPNDDHRKLKDGFRRPRTNSVSTNPVSPVNP